MKIVKKILTAERDSIIGGIVIGSLAFLSVRTLPRLAIRLIGGEQSKLKMEKLRESELALRNSPKGFLKRSGTFLFEGMLGFWVGWKGYHLGLSKQADEMVEEITKLPLVEGRSIVSDEVCPDITKLIRHDIPPAFWKNLEGKDDGNGDGMENTATWLNIQKFRDNCAKRKMYEDNLRANQMIQNKDEAIIIPHPGVPEDIFETRTQ